MKLPIGLLVVAAVLALLGVCASAFGWKLTQSATDRIARHPAIEQMARDLDAKSGQSSESPRSAAAMARGLMAGDEVQRGTGEVLESIGAILLIIAAWQIYAAITIGRKISQGTP